MFQKAFKSDLEYYTEYYIYDTLKDFPYIPKLLKTGNNTLYLEYLHGQSIYDIPIDKQLKIAETLGLFHKFTYNPETELALIHYDTNLHNYIYYDDKIYMLDFAECTLDKPIADVYSLLLFFCEMLSPEDFKYFYEKFISIYNCNFGSDIISDPEILNREIKRFLDRRTQHGKCINNYQYFLVNKTMLH